MDNGVLKKRFATLAKPAEFWDDALRYEEILACLIIHNLCVDANDTYFDDEIDVPSATEDGPSVEVNHSA